MLDHIAVIESGGAHTPPTALLDVITQIWSYLDVYDKLVIRLSCREGLRAHDCLLVTVSIHDLWGRVLPGAPEEMAGTLYRMKRRGCAARELILRLRGCSAAAREARGLAVLSALRPKPGSSVDGDCCCRATCAAGGRHGVACSDPSDDRDGRRTRNCGITQSGGECNNSSISKSNISQLRLEGVPLTPRVLLALAAFGPGLRRLKLYGYDVGADSSGAVVPGVGGGRVHSHQSTSQLTSPPPLASSTLRTLRDNASRGPVGRLSSAFAADAKPRSPGGPSAELCMAPGPAVPMAPAAAITAQHAAAGKRDRDRLHPTTGVSPLLRLLSLHLQELTLQDCNFGVGANAGARRRDEMGGAYIIKCGDSSGGTAAWERVSSTSDDALRHDHDDTSCGSVCRGCSILLAAKPFLDTLQSCSALRHLGLRHTSAAGCPVLQLLLWQPGIRGGEGGLGDPTHITEGGGTQLGSSPSAASATLSDHSPGLLADPESGISRNDVDGAGCSADANSLSSTAGPRSAIAPHGGSLSHVLPPAPLPSQLPQLPEALPPVTLATLTQLASLKIQTALPTPCGLHTLVEALLHLTGLTRLELGDRTAVQTVGSLMLRSPPSLANKATAAITLPQPLRNLRDLSLVSAHATSIAELETLAELRELTRVSLGAISLGPTAAAVTAAVMPAAGLHAAGVPLLQRGMTTLEDVAEMPLPAQLQELSVAAPLAPATLISLCRPPSLRTLRLTGFSLDMRDVEELSDSGGGGNTAAAAAVQPLLRMRSSSQRELSEALGLLQGRFAYRDLGIELHIGFHGLAAEQRRYLTAADQVMGHWAWASRLMPLPLQGLELAGFELLEGDVAALARQLQTLEDLRLDCRYPLPAVAQLSALRRLRRLLLNASFWCQLQAADASSALPPLIVAVEQPPQPQQQQRQQHRMGHVQGQEAAESRESWTGHREPMRGSRSDAEVAAAA
ncbi:hypothetical protein VaNZ11_015623, partial [Volvox africanus]